MTKLFGLSKHFGRRGRYIEPTNEEISNLKELVDVLFSQNENNFNLNNFSNIANKLQLKITELEDKPNSYAFHDANIGPLFFVWNFDKINSGSVLVYCHSGSDNVDSLVLNQYLSGEHRCMVINGLSIASTDKKSLTQPSRTKVNADHSYENLMCHFVHFVNLKDPSLVFINLHGMQSSPDKDLWVINSLSRYNYNIRNYPVLLVIAFLLHFPKIKVQSTVELGRFTLNGKPIRLLDFNRSGPVSSVIGRIIHSGSMDPKDNVVDNGRYVHNEHGISFASKIKNSNDVAMAHSIALKYYKAWDSSHSLKNAPKALEDFEKWLFSKTP